MLGSKRTHWGNRINKLADEEIKRIVNNSYVIVKKVLLDKRPLLYYLAKTLVGVSHSK